MSRFQGFFHNFGKCALFHKDNCVLVSGCTASFIIRLIIGKLISGVRVFFLLCLSLLTLLIKLLVIESLQPSTSWFFALCQKTSHLLAGPAGGQLLTGPVDGFSAGACLLIPLLYQSPSLMRVSFINTLIGNFTFFELLLFIAKT